jgi:membrane associated rhomboid family serine protease
MNFIDKDLRTFLTQLYKPFAFILLLWVVKLYEILNNVKLTRFGIYPREADGMLGIITGPFIHSDVMHLLSNTFPLIILMICLTYFYKRVALATTIIIWLMTGVAVWLFARPSYHIGASGVVYGLIGFVLFSGLFRRNTVAIILSLLILSVYSSYFTGFKKEEGISWESHFIGSIVGLITAFAFKNIKEETENILETDDSFKERVYDYFLPRDIFEKTKQQRAYEARLAYEEKLRQQQIESEGNQFNS